jgi:glycosyltransferase involved in cell wall biosynthesis
MAVLAVGRGGPPIVVHVHDALPENPVSRGSAVSCSAGRCSDRGLALRGSPVQLRQADGRVHVLYNPIDVERFSPDRLTQAAARDRLASPGGAVAGGRSPDHALEGQDVAVRALSQVFVAARTPGCSSSASRSLSAGRRAFDNLRFRDELRESSRNAARSTPSTSWASATDVPTIMRAIDALLVPSWEEPSAAACSRHGECTPVVATEVGVRVKS